MDSKTETLPQAVERPALDSGDLFGVPCVVDNLREWAAEFRANQHPVTLTLFRAIQTLEKMDAAMDKDDREIVRLYAEIARYRAAISDYCEAQDDLDVAGDSKFLDRLRATLEPREKQPTPVWKKYGHPSEVSSPNRCSSSLDGDGLLGPYPHSLRRQETMRRRGKALHKHSPYDGEFSVLSDACPPAGWCKVSSKEHDLFKFRARGGM